MTSPSYQDLDVEVGGLRLHYQEWGNAAAPAIVMVHGFGVSGHMFDEFADRAQDTYRLIAIDQRGHGDSDWASDGDYTREAFVRDLEGFREALALERFILVGHSMGGLNSVWYAARYPERVRALVLVDVGPESAKEGVDNIVRFTRGPDELEFEEFVQMAHHFNQRRSIENIRERMRHRLKPTDSGKWTWKFDRRFRQADGGLRIGHDVSNDEMWQMFRSVRMPVLLIRGAESDVLTQETAERLERELRQARLVVVPGAGHSVPGDNPEVFTDAVRTFLRDFEGGRFEPRAASEPPPIEALLEREARSEHRGPSLVALVVASFAAVLALAGVGYTVRKRRNKKRSLASVRSTASDSLRRSLSSIDIQEAQRKATELAAELTEAGKASVSRARTVLSDVDLDQARSTARDVLDALGERAETASDQVVSAVGRARKHRKSTGRRAASLVGTAIAVSARTGTRLVRREHR
jgi:esterase